MRTHLLVAVVAALLLSIAGAAVASESYWVVKFRAGRYDPGETDGAYTNYGGCTIGASSSPSTTTAPNPMSTAANLALRRYAGGGLYNYYGTERLDSDNPPPYSYEMLMAVGSLYPSSMVYVSAWSPDSYLAQSGRSLPANYRVTVRKGITTLAVWDGEDLYRATDPGTTGLGNVGFYYTPEETNDSWAGVDKDIFTITVDVPEPAGVLALASGLISAAAFALRRRRT